MLSEFKQFIARGNVIDMAVGIVVGAAFTAIVTSLVGDIINPVIGMLLGGLDFSNYYVDLSLGDYPSLEAAKKAGAPLIMYGLFINAVIKFLIEKEPPQPDTRPWLLPLLTIPAGLGVEKPSKTINDKHPGRGHRDRTAIGTNPTPSHDDRISPRRTFVCRAALNPPERPAVTAMCGSRSSS